MPTPTLLAALVLLCAARPAPFVQSAGYSDEQVIAAWENLEPGVQDEIVGWFRAEVSSLQTFQNSLLRFVLDKQPRDAGLWALAETPKWYDPEVHAPAQVIPRRPLGETSSAVEKKREEFFFRVPERKLDSAFIYDYGARELRRTQRLDDPDRIFRNALKGFAPDLDLAEALVEMWLDDGSERAAAVAFSHAYTDRTGRVYTGLTLYDAWSSGSNMEMPDIDNLGIIHDLENDWRTYKAPVPTGRQKRLYADVGELFSQIHRHRGLRHALAMTFFTGHPALRDNYDQNIDRLHGLWDSYESTPEKLAKKLPSSKKWESYLDKWIKKYDGSEKLQQAGVKRRDTLHNDGLWVRQILINVMVRNELLKPDK